MRRLVTALAILAALALIGASCALNFAFWSQQGKTEHEGLILGVVSIAVDLLKAILPILIGLAIAARRLAYVIVASVAFVFFFGAGLISAIGFVAGNRADVIGGREARNAQLELAHRDLAAVEAQISRLSGYPPVATLEAELRRLEQHPRFASSNLCEDATAVASKSFCVDYYAAKANLASAIEVNRLSSKRESLVSEVNLLRTHGAGQEADPQAGIFARWVPGLNIVTVRDALALFFAVLVELGAAFGLFLATRHSGFAEAPQVRGEPVILETAGLDNRENAAPSIVTAPSRPVPVQPLRFVPDHRWIEGPRIDATIG
jgi:hypothetical protein